MNQSSPLLTCLRRHARRPVVTLLLLLLPLWAVQTRGATFYWDSDATAAGNNAATGAGLGGAGIWNTTSLSWWNLTNDVAWSNSLADIAIFTGTSGTVDLGENLNAGGLIFNSSGYTLNGNILTLGSLTDVSPTIQVNKMGLATIASVLSGDDGLVKLGTGSLVLANNNNTYTGPTAVQNGALYVSRQSQLGMGSSTVAVTGISSLQFGGGTLFYDPGLLNPTNFTRNLSIGGRGSQNVGAALITTGFNTFSGNVLLGSVAENRVITNAGITTFTGQVTLGGGQSSVFYGNGSYIFAAPVTQFGAAATNGFYKTGNLIGSTIWLQNSNNNFDNEVRIDSGTIRVATASALGFRTTSSAIRGSGGTLELRAAPADLAAFAAKGITMDGNFTVFADHSLGTYTGLEINQTVSFPTFTFNGGNRTFTASGRNGYGVTIGTNSTTSLSGNGNGNTGITNNSNAPLTVLGIVQIGDNSARTLTVTASGDVTLDGRINSNGTADHIFTKANSGTLTMLQGSSGAASTYNGVTNINDGTLAIRTLKVLNDTGAGRIVLSNGALSFLGDTTTGAGETWTTKTLDVGNTNAYLLANQAGTAPTALILPNNWGATNTGTGKTLNLGGISTQINDIQGLITNGKGLTNVQKYGIGTWQINAPTNYGTANPSLTITALDSTGGTVVTTPSTAGLVVGQPVSGTGFAAGTVITSIISATQFTINQTATSTGTTAVIGTANGSTAALTTTAVSAGTTTNPILTVASTANLVPGQQVTNTSLPAGQAWYIRDITSTTTITLVSATGATLAVGGIVSGQTITPTASTNFGGNLTVTNGVMRANAATASSNIINDTSNLVFANDSVTNLGNAGGTFEYAGFASGSSTETLGRLNPAAGHGIVKITSSTGADSLVFLDISRSAGATLDLQPGSGSISFATAQAGTNGILGGYATFNGLDWVNSGLNATQFTGYTTGLPATGASATANYLSNSSVTTTAAQAVNSLKIIGAQTITLGGTLTFTTNPGGLLFDNSTGAATITGSQLGTTAQELVITTNGSASANALTINSLVGSAASALTKAGDGLLVLTGTNAYTGNTTINQGTVRLSGTAARLGTISTAGNVTTIRQGATLDINAAGAGAALYTGGTSYPATTIGGLSGSGIVTNSGDGTGVQATLNIGLLGTTTAAATFSGELLDGGGVLNVTKNGTGTQAIVGAKSYSGITTINAGTLAVTSLGDGGVDSGIGRSSGAASNLIFGGGTLLYTGASASGAGIYQTTATPTTSTNRLFSLAGNATIQSSGTYGNESGAAGSSGNVASLSFLNTGDLVFLTAGAKTLTLGGASTGDNIFRPRITNNTVDSSATALTKADAGLWILNPAVANTYTGATTINGGALQFVDGVGVSTASNIVMNGGVVQTSGTFNRTLTATAGTSTVSATGNFGFAASVAPLVVDLQQSGGGSATLNLGTAPTAGNTLILSSNTALAHVEVVNPINLGTAGRTIQVDDNGSTGLDFGILSGVISGGVGGTLSKTGGGALYLGNANTYVGSTTVTNGQVVVTSIGNATGTLSSSLGAAGGGLIYNPGDADLNGLIYVGAGETASRPLTLSSSANFSANRTFRIEASGSGPLVLNGAFTHTTRGDISRTLILELRGWNTGMNEMAMVLANSTNANSANALLLQKTDGGTWVVSGANTYTGGTNVNSGFLGIAGATTGTSGTALSTGALTISNAGIFATSTSGLTIGNNVTIAANATAQFVGANSITITNVLLGASGNPWTISNTMDPGATLTFNGGFTSQQSETTARTLSVRGTGATVLNGAIANSSSGAPTSLDIRMSNAATLTLGGAANTYTGTSSLLGQGTLVLAKTGALSSVNFTLHGGVLQSTLALTGANKLTNPVTIGDNVPEIAGTNSIEFGSSTATTMSASRLLMNNLGGGAKLIISSNITNTAAATLTITGTGSTDISGLVTTGTGAQGLTNSGTGTLTLTGANNATGALTANRGITTLSGANGAWAAGTFAINAEGTLRLDNSVNNNANRLFDTGTISMAGGTLDFVGNTTAETAGALTVTGASSINMSGAGSNSLTFASMTFTGSTGVLDVSGVSGLGGSNKIFFTTSTGLGLTPATTGIVPRVMTAGNFVTYGANGLQVFTGYNNGNNLDTAAATDTMEVTASTGLAANRTLNALKISGNGLTVGTTGKNLTLTSANILSTGGSNTLNLGQIIVSNAAYVQVDAGGELTLNATFLGNTLTKTGAGQLNLNTPAFHNTTTNVVGGTLLLNGGLNTLFAAGSAAPGGLNIDAGATLDLNGNTQYVGAFGNFGSGLPGSAGTLKSTTGTPLFVTNGGGTFAGQITGTMNLARVGGGTQVLSGASNVTGSLVLMGGTTRLQDEGTLLNITSLDINYATFGLGNNQSLQTQNNNRFSDTAPITLRGGTINLTGRVNTDATETFGALTAAQGSNTVDVVTGGTGTAGAFSSAVATFASLTRSPAATVNFTGASTLGSQGNNPRLFFVTAPAVASSTDALGSWAIHNSTDYAAYNSAYGVGAIGMAGFTPYTTQGLNGSNVATLAGIFSPGALTDINAISNSSLILPAGPITTDMLRLSGGFTLDVNFQNPGDVLTLALGGLLRSNNNNATNIGTTTTRGVLTSGISELNVYYAGTAAFTINSVITGATRLIKSGAGPLTLTAGNDYTLGTVLNQGTLNLSPTVTDGSVVVIPAGDLVLNGGVTGAGTTLNVNTSGAIAAANNATLNGRAALTYAAAATTNTLNSVTLNNNGGEGNPTVTIGAGGVLTLTSSSPISATSSNAATTATITGGTIALASGTNTIDVGAIKVGSQTYTAIQPTLNIASVITGASAAVSKTGDGILQLSAQSTFNGLSVGGASGGILISGNSTPTQGGGGLMSGPLGIGAVSMAAGTKLVVDGNRSIGNDVAFAGTPTFDSTATSAWTLTLNGQLTGAGLSGPGPTINVGNPFLTVVLLGKIPSIASITSFNKTGPGALIFNSTGYTGDFNASALGTPNQIQLLNDGDGTGLAENIALGSVIFDSGIVPNIVVGRAGGTVPLPAALNKILTPAAISNLGLGITVTNNNGYGLGVTGAVAFTNTPTINVATATISTVTQGLYLSGNLTGTGFIKTGNGTVVINNANPANNTFTGSINIQAGVVSVNSDAQLGNAANIIQLNPSSGTSTLRATGTFTLAHPLQLTGTTGTRAIEVTAGNSLTLSQAFDLNAGAGNAATLVKNDMGTLVLAANNASWTGGLTINQGAVLVNTGVTNPAGTSALLISPNASAVGVALQLAGGNTYSFPISLQGSNNVALGGINSRGQLENLSGNNTFNGAIALAFDAAIGSTAGTLTLGSTITSGNQTSGRQLNFMAYGDIVFGAGSSIVGNTFGIGKYGNGTLDVRVPIGTTTGTGGITVRAGTLKLSGTGTTNTSGAANIVYGGATLMLDNSGTNTNNRLSGRALTLQGGTLNFVSNNSTETAGALLVDQGANTINMTGTGTAALTFSALTTPSAGSSLNLIGTFGDSTHFVKFTTAPTLIPATTGILNRVTVNGNELASYNSTNGIVAFTGYSTATNILSATATSTFKATTSTLNSLTGNQTLNALTLSNTAAVGGLGGNPPATLTLTSGTILANGSGGAFLNVPIIAFGSEAVVHVQSGQSLTVNGGMSGTAGLSKHLPGTLNINARQFVSGTTYVNGGTLKLTTTGMTNPLLFNQALAVNVGGTVDLNGNNQFVAGLSSASAGGSNGIAGGTVTNSAGTQSILTINGNTNYAGLISGGIYLNKTGTGALNLQNAQTYTGPTLLTGGTTTLNDNGALPNTSQPININFAGLSLANGNLYAVANRVSDTAPITLNGGQLTVAGRAQFASSETLGAITLANAFNSIVTNAGGTNVNSLDVTAASLTRAAGTATVRFNATGQLGSSARLVFTSAPTLTNNILGPWAVVDREFASYDATYGIGALNGGGYAGYSVASLLSNPTGTDNVRFTTAGTTTLVGNTTVGTLNFAQQSTATVLNLGTNTLTIQGGGILFGQGTDNIDFSITNGSLTGPSGGGDLYLTHVNLAGTGRTVTLAAPIVDNAGAVRVIYTSGQVEAAGVGNTNVNAVNTHTGGTVINSGNIVLGATGALGTGGLTINQGILTQTAGGVIPASNALTMGGGSLLTLANQANSLAGIIFENAGGAAPTVTPTGTLTLTSGITVNTLNAGSIATIGAGTLDLNGAASFGMNIGAVVINGVDVAPWQAGLNITALIQNGGISKSGGGLLQLSNSLSTFAGGVNVTAGGLVIGANSAGPNLGDPLVSGPLGTGTVTMAGGTTLVAAGAFSVTNDFVFQGDTIFNGTNNLTLNGSTTLPSTWNATVTAPQMVVTIGNVVGSLATDEINKSGLGTLNVGNYNGTINIAGGLIFNADGNTLGTPEVISLGGSLALTADTAVTVNRSGAAPNARNKTLQKVNLTNNGSILAVTNLNGYGLEFTGTTTLTGASHFSVTNASASNAVPGLTLSGVVSDTGGYSLVKSGAGTLLLTNSGNTFGGPGATIDVLNGTLAAANNGALGALGNTISLNVDGSTGFGFRAVGTFSTARTFILNAASNAFEVTAGNILTLTTPFTLATATNALIKNDNGVLAINAANTTMTGAVTINAGAIRALNAAALGSGTITIASASGAALQLAGGVTVSNPLTLTATSTGINTGGIIESVSGVNTYAGAITQTSTFAATYGAQAGATLNLTGTYNSPGANSITFAGAGSINLQTALNNGSSFNKIGNGTLTISVANPGLAAAQTIALFGGTTVLAGAGTLGPVGAATGAVTVDVGSTLTLDNRTAALGNTGSNANDRLGTTRNITFRGGSFNLIGNESVNTTETFAVPTMSRGLSVITVTAQPGAQANLVFTGSSQSTGFAAAQNNGTGPTGASVLFRGTNLGSAAGNGVATIKDTGSTSGFFFNGQSGATGTATKGILPWALIDSSATGNGTSFATGDGTTFTITNLRPLAAGEYGTANTVTASQNVLLNGGITTNLSANIAPNSLTIEGGANLGSTNPFAQLSLSSGGILVRAGSTSTIGGAVINQTNTASPLNIWTVGDLTISSTLIGGNGTANGAVGFVKAGAGTLTISTTTTNATGLAALTGLVTSVNNYSGQLVINQGTLMLNGGTNTIQANNFIAINGGTLDLNGNVQQVLSLFTDGTVSGAGGVVTSSSGTGTLIVNQDNAGRNWAGSIQGTVNFVRSGQNTMTVYSPQTYTGTTLINGGTTTLRDDASLSGTSGIEINYANLTLDNSAGTVDSANRVNDSAAITLRGGTVIFQGRAQTASSETIGAVTLAQGTSSIQSIVGGTGVNSADLTVAALSRATGGGTVNFTAATGGLIGSSSRILIPTINGVSTATVGGGLTNGIIGGWAIIGTSDFATYVPGLGVAAMGAVGAPQYSNSVSIPTTIATAGLTDNVSINVAVTGNTLSLPNDQTINSLRIGNIGTQTVSIAAGKTLTLASGGLLFFSTAQQNIGSAINQGSITSGGSELFVYTQGTGPHVINSVITGNGMTLIKSGGNTLTITGTNNYTGGTVVTQGTLNVATTGIIPLAAVPADGLVIGGGTVTLNAPGSIALGNIVTLNGGGSTLNLFGDNTITGLVLNNTGGGASSVLVNTFSQPAAGGAGTAGILTIGSAGIVATSSNVANANVIAGRVDFGSTNKTVDVAILSINGVQPAPLLSGLTLQAIVGTTGGLTKTGAGILQFGAQSHYTGPTIVAAGGIRNGITNAGSRFSALTLDAGTHLNLNGFNTVWGSLAGSGTVFNSSNTAVTLTVGYDNTSTAFSGQLARFNDAVVNSAALQKIGTGVLAMTSAQSSITGTTGAITVNGGEITYRAAGRGFVGTVASGGGTFNVNTGGTLRVDNSLASTSNLNNRLGLNVAGTVVMQGGSFIIDGNGNDATNTLETLANLDFSNGGGVITLNANAGSQLNLVVTTLAAQDSTGSGLIRGIAGTAAAAGNATLTITTPTLLGSQGTGANGTSTMAVRGDILADASTTGIGTGFLVRDTVTGTYRALGGSTGLASAEYNLTQATWASTQNAAINGSTTLLTVNRAANTLTVGGTSALSSGLDAATFGLYGPNGGLLALGLTINAALVLDGAVATVNIGTLNGTTTNPWSIHTIGSSVMNLNGHFGLNNTGGLVKAGAGTLNFNRQALFTGTLAVNDGTVNLNSGADNTLVAAPTSAGATLSSLNVNGVNTLVDLKGRSQAVNVLSSVNPIPGYAGRVTNSGATAATLTAVGTGTFSGVINGNLGFTRAGNTTTTLTNANTYTGATVVRGGTLQLRDSGAITSTAGLVLNYGTLNWDNYGLNPSGNLTPLRMAAANAVTMQGGVFTINGGGSTDTVVTLNSVTVTGGHNTINVLPYVNEGSTVKLTIGSLNRDNTTHSGINFNGFSQNNSGGASTLGGQGLTQNGQIVLNAIDLTLANAVTTAGSNVVTVSSTAGLFVGGLVSGTGLPAGSRITAITSPTTFTVTSGTGVTAQAATTLAVSSPLINLSLTNAVTTAGSNLVTVASTSGLMVGAPVSGTGIPAGSFITAITSGTTFTITTGTGVTAQSATTLTFNNLNNNLLGGWAVADGNTFATYVSGNGVFTNNGVSVMGQTTQGIVAPGFTGTDVSAALVATGNYNDGSNRTLAAGAVVANSIRFAPSSAQTITFPTTTTLSLGTGIITNAATSTTLAATDATNTITGTGSDLYFYVNQNTVVVQPAIVGSMALVSNGPATLSLRPQFVSNSYTGGTFVQAGTLNLQAAAGLIAIPGNLTITNAAVTMSTTPNQIATTSAVTINGGGTLTLPNYSSATTQTLDSITFFNEGGTGNPGLVYGTPTAMSNIVLSSANPLTATNNSLATTPTISTSAAALSTLQFSNASPVITVNAGIALTGLSIAVPIVPNAGMTGPLTKSGVGALALSGASTFTTGFNLDQGSLIFGANSTPTSGTVTSGPVGTGTLTIGNGTTILSDGNARTIANATTVNGDFTVGGVIAGNGLILSGAMNLGAAGRTITVTSPAVTATISGLITTTATGTALTKAGNGTLIISAANTNGNFGGAGIAVTGGILKMGVDNAIPNTSPLAISAGAGFDMSAFNLTIQTISGAGFITNSGGAKTLIVGGTSATDVTTAATSIFAGALVAATPANLVLTKAGAGSLTLSGSGLSSYAGATTVVGGSLIGGATNAFSPNSVVTVGNTATATGSATATLDTGAFSQTIAGLVAAPNTAAGTAVINVVSGNTLTVNGNVTLGSNTAGTDVTKVNFTGGGDFVINNTGGSFQVGGATGGTNANAATVNMSALGSLTANLGATGTFRVGDVTTGTNTGASTLILPTTSTITANVVGVGDLTAANVTQTLLLGSGVTTINANTLNIGANGTSARANGAVAFNGATGTIKVRSQADPTNGRATLNVANLTFATASNATGSFDTTGHSADLLFGSVILGGRTGASTGGATATFAFDTGTLDVNSLVAGTKAVSTTGGTVAGTATIGGGTAVFNNTTGPVQLGLNASNNGAANGTLTITGGTVTVAANGGTSIVLGTASVASGSATGTLNIFGGVTTLGGDLIKGTSLGTSSAVLNLTGTGTLDMGGKKIGGSAAANNLTTLTFASGTLKNVAEINNGAPLVKTTPGTLVLEGANGYTGATTINGGVVQVSSLANGGASSNLGASSSSAANLILNGGSLRYVGTGVGSGITNRAFSLGLGATAGTFDASGAAGSPLVLTGVVAPTLTGSGTRTLTLTGTNTDGNTLAAPLGDSGGATSLVKSGAGTWVLTGSSTYTGPTTVNAGVLQVGVGGAGSIATSPVTVNSPGTLTGSGSVGSTIIGAGAFLAPGDGSPAISNATLTFTSATLNAGSSTTLTITTSQKASAVNGDMSTILGALAASTYNGIELVIGTANLAAYNNGLGGANHDRLNISGSFSVTGGSTITIADNGYLAGAPAVGDIFNLLDWGSITKDTFNEGTNYRSGGSGGGDLVLPDLSSYNLGWDVSAFLTHGIVVVVPEPGRVMLLLFGLLALASRRRRFLP